MAEQWILFFSVVASLVCVVEVMACCGGQCSPVCMSGRIHKENEFCVVAGAGAGGAGAE